VRRPSIFLFDEPLSNLDAALRAEVRVQIRRLHDRLEATTLYVTHDQVEAMTLADTLWVMNGGMVEQKGAPLEVYERPRTKFVATFLGSPHMNVFEGSIVAEGTSFFAEGASLRLPLVGDRFRAALAHGRDVTIGVRPHDFSIAKGEAAVVGQLKVDIVESLGFEAFAHGTTKKDGAQFVLRLEADDGRAVRSGDTVPLTVDAKRVHLFDRATGISLAE